ncbi:hypothetical protein BO83DRAFT_432661 [Aspergillus eucalypticola CBS 122712]|uniref:Uncharacterized protein n=1 Tax=Aspergillus eucalypticola (strain CBS 122712 / IBT 29274) TaxID=1448314 RepID=A0A317UL22_ASPEC|nr:uncharacterized protein BO83DRAFT_432661 [Aspergillus eucalypticola CBS 122712]PWY62145.1 hypothetical protein BO83DRAFT_432661 [Aspergillus eucalypticola CBS 122712]
MTPNWSQLWTFITNPKDITSTSSISPSPSTLRRIIKSLSLLTFFSILLYALYIHFQPSTIPQPPELPESPDLPPPTPEDTYKSIYGYPQPTLPFHPSTSTTPASFTTSPQTPTTPTAPALTSPSTPPRPSKAHGPKPAPFSTQIASCPKVIAKPPGHRPPSSTTAHSTSSTRRAIADVVIAPSA